MILYIDKDFKCHMTNDGTMTPIETEAFAGKCDKFIEGYRFVPAGQTWKREDGVEFQGKMVSPHTDYAILAAYQEQYEESATELQDALKKNAEYEAALSEIESALGVNT